MSLYITEKILLGLVIFICIIAIIITVSSFLHVHQQRDLMCQQKGNYDYFQTLKTTNKKTAIKCCFTKFSNYYGYQEICRWFEINKTTFPTIGVPV